VLLLTVSTNAVLRLLGIDPNAEEEEVSEEDIRMMAEASAEKGIIEEEERELIENIFEFDDLTVGEIKTHRTDVALLWMEEDEKAWEEVVRSSRYTLYPICEGSIDNIVGVLDTKDYFRMEDRSRKSVLEKAVKTPYFVPEGAKADVTFRNMQKNRVSFAVVLDEYAGFSGIISIKDLLESIVGDMIDADEEHAEKEEEIQAIEENQWRIRGNVSLSVLSKVIGLEFPDDFETVSGLVFSLYGSVPEDGSEFEVKWESMVLSVQEVREHQVVSAVITLEKEKGHEE
jgi:putative hemolysin